MPYARIGIIVNPVSGGHAQRRFKRRLLSYIHREMRLLTDNRISSISLTLTRHGGHATRIAQSEAQGGAERILVCGGDGTVNETAKGLTGTPTALAIVPAGSGNGLARHLGIPMHWRMATDLALTQDPLTIDHGRIDTYPFFTTAGIGFDAEVGWAFAKLHNRGLKSYLQATTQLYFSYKPRRYHLSVDGIEMEVEALMITFANASQFGNDAIIAPEARLDDGFLDLVIVRPFPKVAIGILAAMLFYGSIHRSAFVETIRFQHLVIESEVPLRGHVDGEPVHLPPRLEVNVVPKALHVIPSPHAPELTGLSPHPMHPKHTARRSMERIARLVERERTIFPLLPRRKT